MAAEFVAVYHANKMTEYRIDHGDIAKRSLRNRCVFYLAFGHDKQQADKYVTEQYYQANNMTDTMAALRAAVAAQLPSCQQLMAEFEQRWRHDGLIMDKWFMLQATSPAKNVLSTVRTLFTHPTFSMENPNRVRALIGTFVAQNPKAFHSEDGTGYQFLVEMLIVLNSSNPLVASRLIEPLIRLRRYDETRQNLMYQALTQLKQLDNLSADLFEKITKALKNQ